MSRSAQHHPILFAPIVRQVGIPDIPGWAIVAVGVAVAGFSLMLGCVIYLWMLRR